MAAADINYDLAAIRRGVMKEIARAASGARPGEGAAPMASRIPTAGTSDLITTAMERALSSACRRIGGRLNRRKGRTALVVERAVQSVTSQEESLRVKLAAMIESLAVAWWLDASGIAGAAGVYVQRAETASRELEILLNQRIRPRRPDSFQK